MSNEYSTGTLIRILYVRKVFEYENYDRRIEYDILSFKTD
uniref:DUF3850 domain-containing protein n=1 Tax=Ascaris lumbricoides TaxID=6252 RepID=A0A0M3IMA5_ASCLU